MAGEPLDPEAAALDRLPGGPDGAGPGGGPGAARLHDTPMALAADPGLTRRQKLDLLRSWLNDLEGGGQGTSDDPELKAHVRDALAMVERDPDLATIAEPPPVVVPEAPTRG